MPGIQACESGFQVPSTFRTLQCQMPQEISLRWPQLVDLPPRSELVRILRFFPQSQTQSHLPREYRTANSRPKCCPVRSWCGLPFLRRFSLYFLRFFSTGFGSRTSGNGDCAATHSDAWFGNGFPKIVGWRAAVAAGYRTPGSSCMPLDSSCEKGGCAGFQANLRGGRFTCCGPRNPAVRLCDLSTGCYSQKTLGRPLVGEAALRFRAVKGRHFAGRQCRYANTLRHAAARLGAELLRVLR